MLTNGIELNVLITQVLRVDNDIILGFAISDQHTNLSRVRSHPNVLFEIVLEEVVQSQTWNEDTKIDFPSPHNITCTTAPTEVEVALLRLTKH